MGVKKNHCSACGTGRKNGGMDRSTRLDTLIEARGLSQKGLAELVGIDPARLSEWKRSRWRMPVEVGVRLARALGVPVETLVEESAEPAVPAALPLDEDARYLLRVIADAGLTPGDVARRLLQSLKEASVRLRDQPQDLDILDLPATAPAPHATAPGAHRVDTPRRA